MIHIRALRAIDVAVAVAVMATISCGSPVPVESGVDDAPAQPETGRSTQASRQNAPAKPASQDAPATTGDKQVDDMLAMTEIAPGVMLSTSSAPPEDPQEREKLRDKLMARWHELARKALKNPEDVQTRAQCGLIANQLARFGPKALFPLLDIIGNPDAKPRTKLLAVNCLQGLEQPSWTAKLKPLADPERDVTTRACAVHLMGGLRTPELKPLLKQLADDKERRVRFAALRGLALYGDQQARAEFAKLWEDPDITLEEKTEITRIFANDVEHEKESFNIQILSKAIKDFELSTEIRRLAMIPLGRSGSAEAIPALEYVAEKAPEELIKQIAASMAESLRERSKKKSGRDQDRKGADE